MKVELINVHTNKYGKHKYTLVFTSLKDRVVISTEEGVALATLNVEPIVGDDMKTPINKNSFYLSFENEVESSPSVAKNVVCYIKSN